ncbi:gluconokinase [Rubritalea marina]|uniref:gluconokinase n=1 Tax=Rubritalea marina TaxID=361055 RepID=UPI00036A530F|nr:gluconokinase [Rubritalea marina]
MHKHLIIMGVSGCGKSTIGSLLAEALNARFYDGDDFHPQSNIEKMAAGTPLTDLDRQPWLEQVAALIRDTPSSSVTACSALKKQYRDILRRAGKVQFIHLQGCRKTLLERMQQRANSSSHFMPASLLDSQLATLEDPSAEPDTLSVSIEPSTQEIIHHVLKQL